MLWVSYLVANLNCKLGHGIHATLRYAQKWRLCHFVLFLISSKPVYRNYFSIEHNKNDINDAQKSIIHEVIEVQHDSMPRKEPHLTWAAVYQWIMISILVCFLHKAVMWLWKTWSAQDICCTIEVFDILGDFFGRHELWKRAAWRFFKFFFK